MVKAICFDTLLANVDSEELVCTEMVKNVAYVLSAENKERKPPKRLQKAKTPASAGGLEAKRNIKQEI